MFDATLFGFVAGRWAPSRATAVALGMLALAAPVFASLIQDPAEIAVGIWFLGIAFPWVVGRAAARQNQLATQLDATRRELAEQALHDERRRIARDVHDLVGHGLAATMLQITSARHVLRRVSRLEPTGGPFPCLPPTPLQPEPPSPLPTCKGIQATITGTPGNDVRSGTPGRDVMVGLAGRDRLSGLAGDDVICGGAGKDVLRGGPGKDTLLGQKGKDNLKGGGGKDACIGGKGKDKLGSC